MSTLTAIEIVRESLAKLQDPFVSFHARPEKKAFTTALASVLRAADRYKALERAHDTGEIEACWVDLRKDEPIGTLAELADKLMEGR